MPRTKEQFENMRLKSKGIILETALELFTEKGYHSTSISDIAKKAGVASGLMYNYFNSKEDLLVAMIDEHFEKLFASISQEVGEIPQKPDVRKIIDSIINAIIKSNMSWKLIISVMFQPDVSRIARERVDGFSQHQQMMFEKYFSEMGASRPEESAKVLASVLHSTFLSYVLSDDSEELLLIRRTIIENILISGV